MFDIVIPGEGLNLAYQITIWVSAFLGVSSFISAALLARKAKRDFD